MRLHPRTLHVQHSAAEIRMQLWKAQEEFGLTNIEMLQLLSEAQQSVLKYMLRAERHPDDPDTGADEADED